MMTKTLICGRVTDKRRKWDIFEELRDTNETLDAALCILNDLKLLIIQLPDKLTTSLEQADTLIKSVMALDSFLDDCMETTGVYFEDVEMKLDEMHKSLLYDEADKMRIFSKLVSEVRSNQKNIDALIGNAEAEIYKFLESEDLYVNRQATDARIMEMVLNS